MNPNASVRAVSRRKSADFCQKLALPLHIRELKLDGLVFRPVHRARLRAAHLKMSLFRGPYSIPQGAFRNPDLRGDLRNRSTEAEHQHDCVSLELRSELAAIRHPDPPYPYLKTRYGRAFTKS